MIYLLGMRPGKIFKRALRTRNLWLELGQSAKFWFNPCGSLLMARSKEEIVVLEELVSLRQDIEGLRLLTPKEALKKVLVWFRKGCSVLYGVNQKSVLIPRMQSKRFLFF